MSLDAVTGQPFALELCRNWLKQKTTQPLLFYGPLGAGKKTLAVEVAKALNCTTVSADGRIGVSAPTRRTPDTPTRLAGGCDNCLSCRKIYGGNHPDVHVINLAWQAALRKEPLEKQQTLRIETVMAERHRLLQSPVEGAWKVCILDEAHRMTPDAANVLLKILEEPPQQTAIILLTAFRDRLLTTIVSRCQLVRFRYLDPALPLSHEELEARRQADDLWQSLAHTRPARLVQAAEGRSRTTKLGRTEYERQITALLLPAAQALRSGDFQAQDSVRLLQQALGQLRQNVQPALVYDNLLIQLSRLRAPAK